MRALIHCCVCRPLMSPVDQQSKCAQAQSWSRADDDLVRVNYKDALIIVNGDDSWQYILQWSHCLKMGKWQALTELSLR